MLSQAIAKDSRVYSSKYGRCRTNASVEGVARLDVLGEIDLALQTPEDGHAGDFGRETTSIALREMFTTLEPDFTVLAEALAQVEKPLTRHNECSAVRSVDP